VDVLLTIDCVMMPMLDYQQLIKVSFKLPINVAISLNPAFVIRIRLVKKMLANLYYLIAVNNIHVVV
jgi:hypothetical protein